MEGDPNLFNQYGIILVNRGRHSRVEAELDRRFIDWTLSKEDPRPPFPEWEKPIAAGKSADGGPSGRATFRKVRRSRSGASRCLTDSSSGD